MFPGGKDGGIEEGEEIGRAPRGSTEPKLDIGIEELYLVVHLLLGPDRVFWWACKDEMDVIFDGAVAKLTHGRLESTVLAFEHVGCSG